MRYKVKKDDSGWEIWEQATGIYITSVSGAGLPERYVCHMTSDEILEIFNQTVPRTSEEPYMEGNPDCKHSWRPWHFNNKFLICNNCPAMKKVKRLVPRSYDD